MPPKDEIYNPFTSGKCSLVYFDEYVENGERHTLSEVICDSTMLLDDEGVEIEASQNWPLTTEAYSCSFDLSTATSDELINLAREVLGDPQETVKDVKIVTTPEYIRRPHNLKYPNKKRAKRIWKKWRKRFGFEPEHGWYIPDARITFDPQTFSNKIQADTAYQF